MNRELKSIQVKDFHEKFSSAEAAFLAGYSGIKVEGMTEIRRSLREASVEFKILRNTLAKRAIKDTPYESLDEHFNGPIAVALTSKDVAAAAKALIKFAKEEPNFEIKVGALDGKILTVDEIKGLAELPSREELIAKLLGVLKNVPGGFVGVLSGVPRKFVLALSAIQREKEVKG